MKNSTVSSEISSAGFNVDKFSMLRTEIEMLADDETYLKKIAGAAVLFISNLEYGALPDESIVWAATLNDFINEMPDDLMMDVLQLVRS